MAGCLRFAFRDATHQYSLRLVVMALANLQIKAGGVSAAFNKSLRHCLTIHNFGFAKSLLSPALGG